MVKTLNALQMAKTELYEVKVMAMSLVYPVKHLTTFGNVSTVKKLNIQLQQRSKDDLI